MRLIAHRGSSIRAPENTLAAFRAALEDGADGIELDARLTGDAHVVVMHDDDVARATGAHGLISEMTLAEVRALNAAATFDGWHDVERVPTLSEVLQVVAGRAALIVELKGTPRPDGYAPSSPVAAAVAPLLAGVPDVTVSGFDPAGVGAYRELAPGSRTGVTGYRRPDDEWIIGAAVAGGHAECHVPRSQIDAAFVADAHAAGIAVLTWTVNEPEDVRAMRAIGIDGIFTDDPAGARAALG